MKSIIAYFGLLLAPFALVAQEAEEVVVGELGLYHQSLIRTGEITPRFFVQGYRYLTVDDVCGGWGFVYVEEGYLSSTFGPFCDIGSYFSLGIGLGAEAFPDDTDEWSVLGRYAFTAFVGMESSFVEVYYENGLSRESWIFVNLQVYGNQYFAVGGIAQSGDGVGPKLELRLPLGGRAGLRLWGAPMFENLSSIGRSGEVRLLLGLELARDIRSR